MFGDWSECIINCSGHNIAAELGELCVELLVQPGDGATLLARGINAAKKSVEIVIFRFDRRELERALKNAINRGVFVHALIAHTNTGAEERLRQLELRLLEAGGTVARTADDLLRYHYKMVIIDRSVLYLLGFNFTYMDMDHSRSFGVITNNRRFVQEAIRLFDADTRRQPYVPGLPQFVVSPENSRRQLSSFIKEAKRHLLVYDLRISDRPMIRLLEERLRAGVDIRIIGRVTRLGTKLPVRKLPHIRLHARVMVRDGRHCFVGSQSLRQVELDARREAGMIFHDLDLAGRLTRIFEEDWIAAETAEGEAIKHSREAPVVKTARRVAKAIAKELPPVTPVLEQAVKEVVGEKAEVDLDPNEIEETVKEAVKEAVKEVVKDVVEEVMPEAKTDGSKT